MEHSSRVENTDASLRHFWHPVASSASLDDADGQPVQVTLLGERWMIARIDDDLVAFRDQCPHRLAPLSAGTIQDGIIQCAYHGYRFDERGTCVEIPALGPNAAIPPKANLTTAGGITERYGLIWLAATTPLCPIIEIPEFDDASFDCWYLDERTAPVSAALLMDNFIDATHFPYLHVDTFGADDDGRPNLVADRDGWTVQLVNPGQVNTSPLSGSVEARLVYDIAAPFSLRIATEYVDGRTNTFLFLIQPIDATTSRLYNAQAYNDTFGDAEKMAEVGAFNDRVLDEDFALLATYPDPHMPVDLRSEFHTKADIGTVEYRRLMADVLDTAPVRDDRRAVGVGVRPRRRNSATTAPPLDVSTNNIPSQGAHE